MVDLDERILEYLDTVATARGLRVRCLVGDLRFGLPGPARDWADLVFTDPPYTPDGVRLFLARGVQGLRDREHGRLPGQAADYARGPRRDLWIEVLQQRLQLDRIGKRVHESQGASFSYDNAVVDHIVSKCNDPDSGGRMIDNIITNSLLPALSREFLSRSLKKEELREAKVTIENGHFAYSWSSGEAAAPELVAEPVDTAA